MRIVIVLSLMVVIATSAVATPKHKHRTGDKPGPAASPTNSSGYRGMGQTHELQSKNEDGTQVTLNDHSIWNVDDGDASMSSVWDTNVKITVASTSNSSAPFKLTNKTTGEGVHATFAGYGGTTANNAP